MASARRLETLGSGRAGSGHLGPDDRGSAPERAAALIADARARVWPAIPLVMGIVNVTPDSFSDGGEWLAPDRAIAHARDLVAAGASIIDVGAESTRPYGGAKPVSADEERARLAPVLRAITALGAPVSIDTMKAEIAAWALDEGAAIVNDVWGLQRDPDMARLVAARGVPVVVMHNRESADPAIDIMADIGTFFARTLDIATAAGIARERLILDPGIGFGKTADQSLTVLARLRELRALDLPILVGASRKRFIDAVSPASPRERIGGSIAAHLAAARAGATILRAHDVAETLQALRIHSAIETHS